MREKILKNLCLLITVLIFVGFYLAVTAREDFSGRFGVGIAILVAGGIIYLFIANRL